MTSFSLDQTKRFLEALSSKLPGDHSFTFQTFGDGKHRKKIKELRRIRHGTLEEHAEELKKLNRKGAGIFVTVNMTDGNGREEENITGLRAAFVDADNIDLLEVFEKDPDVDNCYPNILVKSKRGYHAYWLLDRWEAKESFTPLQLALIEKFGTDPEPRDLSRVMRLPGFFHMKDEPTEICSKEDFKKAIQEGRATPVTLERVETFCDVTGHEKNGELRDGDRRGYRISRLVELLNLTVPDITPAWKKQGYVPKPTTSSSHFPPEFRLYLAENYLHRIVPPTKGSGDAHETVGSACRVGHDFGVDMEAYWPILREWGARCNPPFVESDLRYEFETFLKATKYPPGTKLHDQEYNREAQYKNWLRSRGFDVAAVGEIYRDDEEVPWSSKEDRPARFDRADLDFSDTAPLTPFPPDLPPDANLINEALDPIDEHMLMDEKARVERSLKKEKVEKEKRKEKRKELASKGPGYLVWTDHGDPPKLSKTKDGRYKMRPQHPREMAWHFLNTMCKDENGIRTLHFHNDRFVQWEGVCYQRYKPDGYRRRPAQFLALCAEETDKEDGEDNPIFKQFKVNQKRKSELLEALRDLVSLDETVQAPCWLIDDKNLPDPREIIVCQNGLFDVRNNKLLPLTPAFFTLNSLSINYDPNAARPTQFLNFLDSVFGEDDESKKLLKWWFGYCLTQDTRHQKMLMLVGESRSGKGVITRLLEKMVGPRAYGSMKFHKMDANFALSSAIDKTVLVFPDARIGGKIDQSAVVADLLSITGEDVLFIDRKNLDPINVKLNCRIMTVSNEPLKLHDTSGALYNRLLLINFPTGVKESDQDRDLGNRLDKELPGILNWAIEGWRELQENGQFFQPESGQDQLQIFSEQSSPMKQFIEDICKKGPNESIEVKFIFSAWKLWTENMNYKPGNRNTFGKDLTAAFPGVGKGRPRDGGKRVYIYTGISIDLEKLESFVEKNTNLTYESVRDRIWPQNRQTTLPNITPISQSYAGNN
jgi:P4 family phage/plasmid primase-like protien